MIIVVSNSQRTPSVEDADTLRAHAEVAAQIPEWASHLSAMIEFARTQRRVSDDDLRVLTHMKDVQFP